jgi:nucleoside-diphosphate-sugar epimerase
MARRAVILGGTGQIGQATAARLAEARWTVTCAQRGERATPASLAERGVDFVRFDRDAPGALAAVIGDGADAVIDTIAYTAEHARQLLALQGAIGALAVVSSASVYRDDEGRTLDEAGERGFPRMPTAIGEDQPTVEPGPSTYSTRKAALERELLDGARVNLAILRACAIYGPGCRSPREWWFLKRLLDGRRRVPLAYDGRSQFHTAYAGNIAELIRVALDQGGTHVLNAADPDPPSVLQIGEMIAGVYGWNWDLVGVEGLSGTLGATPWSIERDFVVDMSRAQALGYRPIAGYGEAIGETCRALAAAAGRDWKAAFPGLAAYPFDLFDYAAEDRFFAGG